LPPGDPLFHDGGLRRIRQGAAGPRLEKSQKLGWLLRRDITSIGRHVGRTGLNARGHLRGRHLLSDPGQDALAFCSHP